ncbi:MAG: replication-relaxation family protein [Planctomycetaceae bacterium]
MPKRFQTNIGPRDLDILTALDRTPLTSTQLCKLSQTFAAPFRDEHNLRRRLRRLTNSQLIRSWPYALATGGRSPRYFKLTREGYRLLYGTDAALPRRRYFEEISHGHHQHTHALSEVITHIAVCGHRHGITLQHFARENSFKLEANGFTLYPDCGFQLLTPTGKTYNFVVELDNGTERIRTRQDTESIERKIRGYDAHQSQFAANDPHRYLVLFITTRSDQRLQHILALADQLMQNRERTVFVGVLQDTLEEADPFTRSVVIDHRQTQRLLVPSVDERSRGTEIMRQVQLNRLVQSAIHPSPAVAAESRHWPSVVR